VVGSECRGRRPDQTSRAVRSRPMDGGRSVLTAAHGGSEDAFELEPPTVGSLMNDLNDGRRG
jgi:hypothetical protein